MTLFNLIERLQHKKCSIISYKNLTPKKYSGKLKASCGWLWERDLTWMLPSCHKWLHCYRGWLLCTLILLSLAKGYKDNPCVNLGTCVHRLRTNFWWQNSAQRKLYMYLMIETTITLSIDMKYAFLKMLFNLHVSLVIFRILFSWGKGLNKIV